MAVHEIPIAQGLRAFDQTVSLDGTSYRLGFQWNARAEQWLLSIAAADGTPLVSSLRLSVDYPLLRKHAVEGLPPGELVVLDQSDVPRDPQLQDLGGRARLFYVDQVELD